MPAIQGFDPKGVRSRSPSEEDSARPHIRTGAAPQGPECRRRRRNDSVPAMLPPPRALPHGAVRPVVSAQRCRSRQPRIFSRRSSATVVTA